MKNTQKLLEAAGVDTVKELKHRKPENLASKMKEINDEKKLTRSCPKRKGGHSLGGAGQIA